jgi:hypoxanthine-guanine phosphoribosyltransferase
VKDDYFLVGYGLDYQERLRNLDYVGAMDLEAIKT